ncbi:MAG: FAD-dependent oxidoreductase, partial [Candidatus Pelagibacter ubique]
KLTAEYFIDCTGDGTIGALANIPFNMGQESRETYNEDIAPKQANNNTFGNTVFFYTKKVDKPVKYVPPDFAFSMEQVEQMIGGGGRIVNETMNGCDYWWFETGGKKNTISDFDNISFELKQLVLGVWNYIKNSGKFDADNLTLEWIGNVPGKRESRRMITEKILTQKDVIEPKKIDDGAFYGGWYLDFHPSDGVNTDEEFCNQIPVHIYPIPFGTLYNKKCKNLLFAGRDIGTSHVAFASTRIMNTCALSGQAASTLCAVLMDHSKNVDEITDTIIKESQKVLIKNDVFIPFINNKDVDDLAQTAKIDTSDIFNGNTKENGNKIDISNEFFMVIPPTKESIYILMDASEETEIQYNCYPASLPSRK